MYLRPDYSYVAVHRHRVHAEQLCGTVVVRVVHPYYTLLRLCLTAADGS